mmetsp:Transcript_110487/g.276620  ORF Transcript_110487/g.276620 Transcript_110487/m.276620 type:complete len:246 (-) Transcript_110487:8-745(-)
MALQAAVGIPRGRRAGAAGQASRRTKRALLAVAAAAALATVALPAWVPSTTPAPMQQRTSPLGRREALFGTISGGPGMAAAVAAAAAVLGLHPEVASARTKKRTTLRPTGGWDNQDMQTIAEKGGIIGFDPEAPQIKEILANNPEKRLGEISKDLKDLMVQVGDGDFSTVNKVMVKDMPDLRLILPVLTASKGTEETTVLVRGFYDNLDEFVTRLQGGPKGSAAATRSLKKMCVCLDGFATTLTA